MQRILKVGDLVRVDLSVAFEGLPPTNDDDQNIGMVMDIHKDENGEKSYGVQLGMIYEYFEKSAIITIS